MNLMCPARLIVLPDEVRVAGLELAGERIAQVYASAAAEEPASRLADHLGVRLSVVPELSEPVLRDAALLGIADLHRGETVVVLAPGLDLGFAMAAGRVVIEHDGDGWSVVPGDAPMR